MDTLNRRAERALGSLTAIPTKRNTIPDDSEPHSEPQAVGRDALHPDCARRVRRDEKCIQSTAGDCL
jgi:hypothetical protein